MRICTFPCRIALPARDMSPVSLVTSMSWFAGSRSQQLLERGSGGAASWHASCDTASGRRRRLLSGRGARRQVEQRAQGGWPQCAAQAGQQDRQKLGGRSRGGIIDPIIIARRFAASDCFPVAPPSPGYPTRPSFERRTTKAQRPASAADDPRLDQLCRLAGAGPRIHGLRHCPGLGGCQLSPLFPRDAARPCVARSSWTRRPAKRTSGRTCASRRCCSDVGVNAPRVLERSGIRRASCC